MTLQQFKRLQHSNKRDTVWNKGEHIATRYDGVYSITLWQIGGFYVEIHFNLLRSKITAFESFAGGPRLEPWLEQVDISSLFT